jgi:hypothetical protein
MILRKLVPEVAGKLASEDLAKLDGSESLADYEADIDREMSIDDFEAAMADFRGRDLTSVDDAEMAVAVRRSLPLTPREAADKHLWWWLTVRRVPEIVKARWADGEPPQLKTERMLGPMNRNALARLWWGAQMVQSLPDPDKYTGMMFRNQDLFEAVIGRSLGRYPEALQVILEELSPFNGERARMIVRDLRFLLSTLVLEALTPSLLRGEVRRLVAATERSE